MAFLTFQRIREDKIYMTVSIMGYLDPANQAVDQLGGERMVFCQISGTLH
jgi:hypothetical protein